MAKHNSNIGKKERRKIKGTDVYCFLMYAGWIWYIFFSARFYHEENVWMDWWLTAGTIGLFLVETVLLYRLARLDEGKTEKQGMFTKAKSMLASKAPQVAEIIDAGGLEDDIEELNSENKKLEEEIKKVEEELKSIENSPTTLPAKDNIKIMDVPTKEEKNV